ncbi:class I SAM-dependent methyltransferase [Candidatus Latescibacterota bacterium]
MEWFENWFGEEYLLVYDHRDIEEAEKEAAFISDILDLKENETVLDLCCGSGRHDFPFVRMGCRVFGFDYSMTLLKTACECVPPDCKSPSYIRGDARELPFENGSFDVVLSLFTSFGYFEDNENEALLASIARILKPGGRFYIDYLNPVKVARGLVKESTSEKNGMKIFEKRTINHNTKRVEKTIQLVRGNDKKEFHESVRLYTKEEMLEMLNIAGLTVKDVIGSINNEPYSELSNRMIIYGFKK